MIANWIISHATGVKLHDYGCSLKVFRAEVVKPLRLYGEMHRFLPAIASELGVRIVEQVVNHRPRQHGRSKYGLGRTVRVVLDLMTVKFLLSYATRPLQIFGLLGIIMGGLGAVITGWLAYLRLFGTSRSPTGRSCSSASCWCSRACSSSPSACSPRCRCARITSRRASPPTSSARFAKHLPSNRSARAYARKAHEPSAPCAFRAVAIYLQLG